MITVEGILCTKFLAKTRIYQYSNVRALGEAAYKQTGHVAKNASLRYVLKKVRLVLIAALQ